MADDADGVISLRGRVHEAGIEMAAGRDDYLERVKGIVLHALAGHPVTVTLFGSCARGDWRHGSDVDIAVEAHGPLPRLLLSELRETLEESTIPYNVDIVDLSSASPRLKKSVSEEGIVWTSCATG